MPTSDLIILNYENVDTDSIGERLYRGRVFQGHIVGVVLKNISPSTMTVVNILENFPHIIMLDIRHGVSLETLGDLKSASTIISMRIPMDIFKYVSGFPPRLSTLEILMDGPILSSFFLNIVRKNFKNRGDVHLTLKIHDRDTFVPDVDLMNGIGDMNISIYFHKT